MMTSVYKGIKKSYPKASSKLGDYFQLTRPFTVMAPVVMAFCIMGIERLYHGDLLFLGSSFVYSVILAGLSMGLLQIVGQVSNQICDGSKYDTMAGKGYRPICRGTINDSEAWTVVFVSLILALSIGFHISDVYGAFMMVLLFFAVFYNLEPIRIKKRFGWNLFWLGASRGFIPPVAFWSVTGEATLLPILLGIVGFLYVFATNWVKDINDYEADIKYNVETLVVKFNKDLNHIAKIMMPVAVVNAVLILIIVQIYAWEFLSLLTFVVFASVILIRLMRNKTKKMERMENTLEWVLFYVGLAGGYMITFIVFRIRYFVSAFF
ncbi:MAG: UbiA family prenyltransferase [Thermoplasmata archaeon]